MRPALASKRSDASSYAGHNNCFRQGAQNLVQRRPTLEAAYAENTQRFRRPPEPAQPPREAWINRPTLQTS